MPWLQIKNEISQFIAQKLHIDSMSFADVLADLAVPPDPKLGQLAFPCFKLSKILKKSPASVAADISSSLEAVHWKAVNAGPYVNFTIEPNYLYKTVWSKVLVEKMGYGSEPLKPGENILVEYCSPNIAKRLAVQHIRSSLLGNVLSNIYKCLGYNVTRMNFVGDWGAQFAKLVAGAERWGNVDDLLSQTKTHDEVMAELLTLYVRFHKEVDDDSSLNELASQCLQRLESKEARATAVWQLIRNISIQTMDQTLKKLSVSFDVVEGESLYVDGLDETFKLIKEKANAKMSEGAWIVELDGIATPALIQKGDGTSLYITRDIAACLDRKKRFQFSKCLYVVSEQQKLHFQQLFACIQKMGMDWSGQLKHISFGTVLFGKEKMSTREGRIIFLDDMLSEATKLALAACTEKNPGLENKEVVAQQVGVGAIIFGELSAHRTRDIEFTWEHVLNLEGDTGPYVQYSAVRCQSLLDKAAAQNKFVDQIVHELTFDISLEETMVLVQVARFRETLHQVLYGHEPYLLTNYLIDLSKALNRFYRNEQVLSEPDPLKQSFRIQLVFMCRTVFENGLRLLGIQIPKEM